MPHPRPFVRLAALLAASAVLGGCTTMAQDVAPGSPLADAEAQYGPPNYTCTKPDGTRRAIWTQQPMGQYAWGTDVTPDGRVVRMEALLTDEYFRRLGQGEWTAERVQCEFGPPARVDGVGLPSSRQIVWAYRYRQESVWNSLMYVYMGRDGTRVTRYHPGPDPMYDDERFGLW
ncbi:hypothetical protein [Bordetella genomosp. 13]|uniref:Lipoprotein n=1 Tax=Bordetella genomosp. 13 TaxID=463040 RepID=A0A1W6ZFH5_9BORD|nr:hypothetical protein CAL15_17525 [Bordetella genomosp. 13]